MNIGDSCDQYQLQGNCKTVQAWPVIWQSQFNQLRVCGKVGGQPFVNVTRPSLDGACPSDYQPCQQNSVASETLCYPQNEIATSCPITDFKIVEQTAVDSFTSQGYESVTYNSSASIVYSKQVPQLPPTTVKVETEPCMDAFQQSGSTGEQWYLPEMQRNGCTTETNTGLTFDPRFSLSGLYTNLADVQSTSGVESILEGSLDYGVYITDPSQKQQDPIRSWNRPTLNWSLECESQGKTRQNDLETVQGSTIITQSWHVDQLRKLAIAMLSLFGAGAAYIVYNLYKHHDRFWTYEEAGMILCGQRLCYVIMMPIGFVAIFKSMNLIIENQDRIQSLQYVADCMDTYTVLDSAQVTADLDE